MYKAREMTNHYRERLLEILERLKEGKYR